MPRRAATSSKPDARCSISLFSSGFRCGVGPTKNDSMPARFASSTIVAMFRRLREIEIPAAGSALLRAITSRFSVSALKRRFTSSVQRSANILVVSSGAGSVKMSIRGLVEGVFAVTRPTHPIPLGSPAAETRPSPRTTMRMLRLAWSVIGSVYRANARATRSACSAA